MTLVERVARAIYHAAFANHYGGTKPEPGWCWEKAGLVQQEFAQRQARAALAVVEAAMQEPSEAMLDAAALAPCRSAHAKAGETAAKALARHTRENRAARWRAMAAEFWQEARDSMLAKDKP